MADAVGTEGRQRGDQQAKGENGNGPGQRDGRQRSLTHRLVTRASLLLPVAVLAAAGWQRRWVSEDGFINFRVVHNLLEGYGPVFNPGERVEIATSVLWTYLLATARLVVPVQVEWLAVAFGLAFSVGGLLLASVAALRLWSPFAGPAIPLGSLVVVALPPVWDFATSGLETGLSFLWLGGCFWLLTTIRVTEHRPSSSHLLGLLGLLGTAAVVGLGPLVRPDFALFSAGFLVALILLAGGSWRRRGALVAAALALPVLYQVFRMGYYAALVPNPALAKEAALARWSVGWGYVVDFFAPYWLLAPLLVVLAVGAVPAAAAVRRRARREVVLVVVPLVTAVLHGVYIVRVGGDFMHGRLLLPAVFALVMPFMLVSFTAFARVGLGLTLSWAVLSMTTLRVPYERVGPRGIADERGHYVAAAGEAHPVTLEDYGDVSWVAHGLAARRWADQGRRVLAITTGGRPAYRLLDLGPQLATTVAMEHPNVGIVGVAAGERVHVIDLHGLGDPVGARLHLERRGRPGHEKFLDRAWVLARYADPEGSLPAQASVPRVEAARRALGCGALRTLQEATHDRLTPGLFLANVRHALQLHQLRLPNDPERAAAELCPPPESDGAAAERRPERDATTDTTTVSTD